MNSVRKEIFFAHNRDVLPFLMDCIPNATTGKQIISSRGRFGAFYFASGCVRVKYI